MKSLLTLLFIIMVHISILNSQIAEKAEDIKPILTGATLPNAELKDQNGMVVHLNDILLNKQTVLVFYRGSWCPFCNQHLSALATSQEEIIKLGYQIIAISPDDYQNLIPMIKVDKLNYKLYSDPDGKLIRQIGLAFKESEQTKIYIASKTTGATTQVLPVPALMVVNGKSEIVFEYINPDFKHRITQKLLLAILNNLN
jgi:peroxiredoxin